MFEHLERHAGDLPSCTHCLDLLETSTDSQILSIAAWDTGEFVRFHPRGRQCAPSPRDIVSNLPNRIVGRLDMKLPLMKLLSHGEETVKNNALLALQKVMVTSWYCTFLFLSTTFPPPLSLSPLFIHVGSS